MRLLFAEYSPRWCVRNLWFLTLRVRAFLCFPALPSELLTFSFHASQPSTPKTNTVHNIFRRAGLVPDDWSKAWKGLTAFVYKMPTSWRALQSSILFRSYTNAKARCKIGTRSVYIVAFKCETALEMCECTYFFEFSFSNKTKYIHRTQLTMLNC